MLLPCLDPGEEKIWSSRLEHPLWVQRDRPADLSSAATNVLGPVWGKITRIPVSSLYSHTNKFPFTVLETHTHTFSSSFSCFHACSFKPPLKKEHFSNFREALLILPFLLSKQADCTNWSRASLNALTFLQCYGVPPSALAREISSGNVTILPLLFPSFHIPPEDRYIEPTSLTFTST